MLQQNQNLGSLVKDYRLKKNLSMSDLAKLIGSNRSYIYKLEQGIFKPSIRKVEKIARALDLNPIEFDALLRYAENFPGQTIKNRKEAEGKNTMETNTETKKMVQISVPNNLQVLYTDTAFVTSRPFGITIDFAQFVGPTEQQNVVSRIGMSVEHAEVLVGILRKKISEAKLLSKSNKHEESKN